MSKEKSFQEEEYNATLSKIASLCGLKFGIDVGYKNLADAVEVAINDSYHKGSGDGYRDGHNNCRDIFHDDFAKACEKLRSVGFVCVNGEWIHGDELKEIENGKQLWLTRTKHSSHELTTWEGLGSLTQKDWIQFAKDIGFDAEKGVCL